MFDSQVSRTLTAAVSAATAFASLYYVYRKFRGSAAHSLVRKSDLVSKAPLTSIYSGDKIERVSNLRQYDKEKLTPEVAFAIKSTLKNNDVILRTKAIDLLQQASAFSANWNVIRDSGCVEMALTLLDPCATTKEAEKLNLVILQLMTNLSCDPANLHQIEKFLDAILEIADTPNYTDNGCAALQILCNLTLTPAGCSILCGKVSNLLQMLRTNDIYILRHLFSILVNFSCDNESLNVILNTQAPSDMLEKIVYVLSTPSAPLVTLKAVIFLQNAYLRILNSSSTADENSKSDNSYYNVRMLLEDSKLQIKLRLFLHMDDPSPDTPDELPSRTEALCELLQS